MGSIRSIYEDRKSWILQRLLSSPTPRSFIIAGKLVGTLLIVTVQILLLMISLSVIASVSNSQITFLWGSNWFALSLTLLTVSVAVAGVAIFVVGIAPTPEQAATFGSFSNAGSGIGGWCIRLPTG